MCLSLIVLVGFTLNKSPENNTSATILARFTRLKMPFGLKHTTQARQISVKYKSYLSNNKI